MTAIFFYFLAIGLLAAGGYLIKSTSPYSRIGGDEYGRRVRRRMIGQILLVVAALALGLGALNQIVHGNAFVAPAVTKTHVP